MIDREPDGYEFLEDAEEMLLEEFIYEYSLAKSIRNKHKRRSIQANLYRGALKQTRPMTTQMLDTCEKHYQMISDLKGEV